jgi:predicted acyltransferase
VDAKKRLVSLDVFRGATVAGMLLVNNPGTWSAVWPPLEHAEWHGWTPTDLIFPFFLFIVGITTELSRKDTRGILRRGALIVLAGLLLNAFPFYWWGKTPGITDPTLLDRVIWRVEHLRFAGVLQRIGVVYTIAALLAMRLSRRALIAATVAILFGTWAIYALGPLEPPDATIAARVDRAVLGANHIWSISKTWDPEGPLSTVPAIATALLGILTARAVKGREVGKVLLWGAAGVAAGLAWNLLLPINKNLWTSSYVVFAAGCACVLLALCIWLIDVRGVQGWTKPFVVYGVNPLVAFLGSGVMARLLGLIKVDGVSLQALSYRTFFEPWFEPHLASFLWALTFVLIWLAILGVMYRRGLIVKL